MKLHFCTLFDYNYLSRGLALYESLKQHCPSFHLYVYAFDQQTLEFFSKGDYPCLSVISLNDFEDKELLRIKPSRSSAEYCWTCTPSIILHAIDKFELPHCTYLDADMYFYSDPSNLILEAGNQSVIISKHRYSEEYKEKSVESGIYCVQFMYFKNDARGMTALHWWRNACIDWCYARAEDGKFGDQKYLDDWTTRFEGVHVLENLGGGIAPWNVQQYSFLEGEKGLVGREISSGKVFHPVFFHFHGLKFYSNEMVSYTDQLYNISPKIKKLFFKPYVQRLLALKSTVPTLQGFTPDGARGPAPSPSLNFVLLLRYYFYDLKKSSANIFGAQLRNRLRHYHFHKIS